MKISVWWSFDVGHGFGGPKVKEARRRSQELQKVAGGCRRSQEAAEGRKRLQKVGCLADGNVS